MSVEVLAPYTKTAKLAFDKYEMYKHLSVKGINTVRTRRILRKFDGVGVDFIKMTENNLQGEVNEKQVGAYDEGVVMMIYDSVVNCKPGELVE